MKEGAYLALVGRIRLEIDEIARVAERATRIWATAANTSSDYYLDATALNLHSFYAGIERLLEAIADDADQIGLLVRDLDATLQLVTQDLLAFASVLEQMATGG